MNGHTECLRLLMKTVECIIDIETNAFDFYFSSYEWSHRLIFTFLAMNGHTECLRLLMETADDNNIVDVSDSLDR